MNQTLPQPLPVKSRSMVMKKWLYEHRYINCFVFALITRIKYGGRVEIRRSKSFPHLPHFVWIGSNGNVKHYKPIHRRKGVLAFFHAWFYKGEISTVDDYERWVRKDNVG